MNSIKIDGTDYLTQQAVLQEFSISRQTLWRWRRDGCIPAGRLHRRSNQLLFSVAEVEQIRDYADRLEPSTPSPPRNQRRLFSNVVTSESSQ